MAGVTFLLNEIPVTDENYESAVWCKRDTEPQLERSGEFDGASSIYERTGCDFGSCYRVVQLSGSTCRADFHAWRRDVYGFGGDYDVEHNAECHDSLHGSAPTSSSPAALGPVTVSRSGWVRAAAFLSTQRSDITEMYYTVLP